MSIPHRGAAWDLEIPPLSKLVLMRLAWHACETCGLAWPSNRTLCLKTGIGETRVRASLDELTAAGHLRIHAYATGGRGRSTQYIVLPSLAGLSTAPCGKCQWNLQNPSRREPFDKHGTAKGSATRTLLAKGHADEAKRVRGGNPEPIAQVFQAIADAAKKPGGGEA